MLLKQNAAHNAMIFMTDAADHISGLAGLTLTITASKNGAAFSSIMPTVTDLGDGWYNLELTTTHTDTLGDFVLHVTSAGADPTDRIYQVVLGLPGEDSANITAIKAKTDNLPADPAGVSNIPTPAQNAEYVLLADWESIVTTPPAYCLLHAAFALRCAFSTEATPGQYIVYKPDGSIAWQRSLSTDPNAEPIVSTGA